MTDTQMIILGYIIFILYMPIMFGLGQLLGKKTKLQKEIIRKIQHLLTSVAWLLGAIFFGQTIHIIIINLLGFIALTYATFSNKLNFISRDDCEKSYGLMYFGLGTLLAIIIGVYIVPELFLLTSIPYYCLAFADGLAPLIVRLFKNRNIKITEGKSLVGSLSIFFISFLVVLFINSILDIKFKISFMLAIACFCMVLELFGEKGLDNLLIELGLLGLLILNHYNLVTLPVLISIISAPIILILALIKKSITLSAAIMGLVMSLSISIFAGSSLLLLLLLLFLLSEIVSKIIRKIKGSNNKNSRGFKQIFSITFVAILLSILFYIYENKILIYTAYLAIIGQLADSMASDIGSLSKKKPIDIIKLKKVENGTSGGITFIGTLAALITSILGGVIVVVFEGFILKTFIIIIVLGFIGTLIDSIFGSLLQVKYECLDCGNVIEYKNCCNQNVKQVSGVKFIDNATVNFLTSVFTTIIALAIFMVV